MVDDQSAVFNRSDYTQLWLTLSSNEQLGVLDSSYIEDYNGVDGQISLYHEPSGQRFSLPMVEVNGPVPHEVFRGWMDLTALPDGLFHIQGKVRDVLGNVTVLGDVATPVSGVRIMSLSFSIEPGAGLFAAIGPLIVGGGHTFHLNVPITPIQSHAPLTLIEVIQPATTPVAASHAMSVVQITRGQNVPINLRVQPADNH